MDGSKTICMSALYRFAIMQYNIDSRRLLYIETIIG